jgi:hypothetical protein
MKENLVRFVMKCPRRAPRAVIVLFVFAGGVLSGCSMRKQPGIQWATVTKVKPVTQARAAANSVQDPLPELRFELPPFPGTLTTIRNAPPRARNNGTPPPSAQGHEGEKLGAPVIAPQLTPQESAVAQQQTNQSLGIAEKNLGFVRGKKLNSAQSDLISKITGFIKDAREAVQIADWSRARGMAKKAQVLSEELASSL